MKVIDSRELYLRTSMKILCDFYHNELEHSVVDWTYPDMAIIWHEIEAIALWWENVYPTYKLIWNKPEHIKGSDSIVHRCDRYAEYWAWLDSAAEQHIKNEETEQLMVERLSKIYKHLWV